LARPAWFVDLIKMAFPQRYRLARLTNLPLVGEVVDRGFFNGDDLYYLPADRSIMVNESVSNPGDYVLPSQIVDHFIDAAAHHWVMDFCLCRDSNHCKDYPRQLGCLFLGEAVHQINPKLGHLVSREAAHQHIQRCREAGLMHMVGRNKLDAFWLGAGPGEKLMTICNCCPCCCLYRVLPDITPRISAKINRLPGVNVLVNDNCLGCGECTQGICFVDAIRMVEDRARIGSHCRGCGHCIEVCPNEAIELQFDQSPCLENTIQRLSQLVQID
jgi:Pyruvate/2-oxoacid:ferredoxin oxidoreductase delta subunit